MNSITKDITLGFYDEVGRPSIFCRQSDTERRVRFQLIDEMAAYIIEDVTYIAIKIRYADGTIMAPYLIPDYETSEDKSELTIKLTPNMLACPGVNKCDLIFIKADEPPRWDEEGHIISDNSQILTTCSFNLYVDGSVYNDGCMTTIDNVAASELLALVISAQSIIDHDKDYQANEATRIDNENLRIAHEAVRVENEDKRVKDNTRINAWNEGGEYTDDDGETVVVKNTYTDRHGQVHPVDISDLQNMSYIALAGYMKSILDEEYYPKLAKSWAVGGTGIDEHPGEDTDNSMYYSNLSKGYKDESKILRDETANIRHGIDEALENNMPRVWVDPETRELMYTGGRFELSVNNEDGYLYYVLT